VNSRRSHLLLLPLAVGACHDEPPPPVDDDACPIVQLRDGIPSDPTGTLSHWRIDIVDMPNTATEANQFAMNLDCDEQGRPDNALGQIVSTIYSRESSDIDAEIKAMIDAGRLIELLSVRSTGLVDATGVALTLRHGTGVEPYGIDVELGSGTITGTIDDGDLDLDGDQLPIGLALPSLDEVIVLPVGAARIRATISTQRIEGFIGGGIAKSAWDLIGMPFLYRGLTRAIERDCPALEIGQLPCLCTPSTFGELLLQLFDEDPEDCELTLDELRNNTLVQSLFEPDVDLFDEDGDLNPRTDGIKDSLSIGFGFRAVPTSVVEP
jgi:hypothetical protein